MSKTLEEMAEESKKQQDKDDAPEDILQRLFI